MASSREVRRFYARMIAAKAEVVDPLAAALETRRTDDVRSLRLGTEPDDTAWCIGDGWWLSSAEP
jgi:hypothetical protein